MGSKIINISLPERLLKLIDEVAGKENRSRSEFFREAARRYIHEFRQRLHYFPSDHPYTMAELREFLEEGKPPLSFRARRALKKVRKRVTGWRRKKKQARPEGEER